MRFTPVIVLVVLVAPLFVPVTGALHPNECPGPGLPIRNGLVFVKQGYDCEAFAEDATVGKPALDSARNLLHFGSTTGAYPKNDMLLNTVRASDGSHVGTWTSNTTYRDVLLDIDVVPASGTVVAVGFDDLDGITRGVIIAFDAATRTPLWTVRPVPGVIQTVLATDEAFYVATFGHGAAHIAAVRPADGTLLWSTPYERISTDEWASLWTLALRDGVLVAAGSESTADRAESLVVALEVATGAMLWTRTVTATAPWSRVGALEPTDYGFAVASSPGVGSPGAPAVEMLDAQTGMTVWRRESVAGERVRLLADEDRLLILEADRSFLSAWTSATGAVEWTAKTDLGMTHIALVGDRIVLAGDDCCWMTGVIIGHGYDMGLTIHDRTDGQALYHLRYDRGAGKEYPLGLLVHGDRVLVPATTRHGPGGVVVAWDVP